jgi:glyoxylase-like metal-dependent hydrolase (beta-lactamase superfamily II)
LPDSRISLPADATPVAPGIHAIRIPIPNVGLDHVLVYAVETEDGLLLVDTGWDADSCRVALEDGLAAFGAAITDVRGVIATHMHPDHYGLATFVRQASGAWVAAHAADAELIPIWYFDQAALVGATVDWMCGLGAPLDEATSMGEAMVPWSANATLPDRLLVDGETFSYSQGTLTVVHTPGHTPGHIVLVSDTGVVITGDHVLPKISPNISTALDPSPDPLGSFMESLSDARLPVDALALPGHDGPFAPLGARMDELTRHHEIRLDMIATLVRTIGSAWEVARVVEWFVPWGNLDLFSRRIALGEAHAHLIRLERSGRARRLDGPVPRWLAN